MTTQAVNASQLAGARARVYQLLAAAYIRPHDRSFIGLMAGWVASQVENDSISPSLSEQMRRGLATMDAFFREADESSGEKLSEAISVEYTRLFRGVKSGYSPLPPYESVYREESGRVFTESTLELQREYRRFGVGLVSELQGEPPDHVSFELEFMYLLCSREARAWDKDDEDEALGLLRVEKEFSRKHLEAWLPKFCNKIREYDRLGFFRGLADLTEGWVAFDYQQHLQDEPLSSAAEVTED